MKKIKFKFIPQHDQMDCGPACLAMVANSYGKNYPLTYLRENSYITREGVSLSGIKEAANKIGLSSISAKLSLKDLIEKKPLGSILYWNQNHFVVLCDIKKNGITIIYSKLQIHHMA